MIVRVYSPTSSSPAFEPAGQLVSVKSFAIPGRKEYRLAWGMSAEIREDVRDFAPSIVHLSAPDRLGWQAQLFAIDQLKVPVVASLHTLFERYFAFYGLSFLQASAERYLARFYGKCDRIFVPTLPLMEEYGARYGTQSVRLWQRGVDRLQFHPDRRDMSWRRDLGIADHDVVPLLFGRIVLEKGVTGFADAIAALRARGRKVHPLVVGDGPALGKLRDAMPDAVFTGHLTGENLARAVASADFMINPSTTEAFGNVVLEAMASGLAVISSDTPSARNILTHGANGLLYPPAEPDALIDAAERLIADAGLRQHMAANAAATAARYDWSAELSQVCNGYRELLRVKELA